MGFTITIHNDQATSDGHIATATMYDPKTGMVNGSPLEILPDMQATIVLDGGQAVRVEDLTAQSAPAAAPAEEPGMEVDQVALEASAAACAAAHPAMTPAEPEVD